MKAEIFETINLLSGDEIVILICRGSNISRANFKQALYSNESELDIVPYIMSEICLLNGEKQDISYFLNLLSDDYMKICKSVTNVIQNMK